MMIITMEKNEELDIFCPVLLNYRLIQELKKILFYFFKYILQLSIKKMT